MITSSYDNTARLWAAKTWLSLDTLQGHDNNTQINVHILNRYRLIGA